MQSFSAVQTNKVCIGKNITQTKEKLFVNGKTRITDSTFIEDLLNVKKSISIGNPTSSVSLNINTSDAIRLPVGNTSQRPDTSNTNESVGFLRYNTDLDMFEGFGKDNTWNALSGQNNIVDVDIDKITDNILLSGNLSLKNKISAKETELTSLTPNLILTYPGMTTKEITPNYSNYIYTSPSGSLNINPSINNTTGNVLNLLYNKGGGSSSAYEYVSRIRMVGQNDGSTKGENSARYGEIATQIIDATDNSESSNMEFAVMNNGTLTDMLILCGKGYENNTNDSMLRFDTNILAKKDVILKGNHGNDFFWNKKDSKLSITGNKDSTSIEIKRGDLMVNDDIVFNKSILSNTKLSDLKNAEKLINSTNILHSYTGFTYKQNDNTKRKIYGIIPENTINNISNIPSNSAIIDYNKIIAILLETVKSHSEKIEKLTKDIDNIKSKSSK